MFLEVEEGGLDRDEEADKVFFESERSEHTVYSQ